MDKEKNPRIVFFKGIRLAFCDDLFVPQAFKREEGKPKSYSCKLLIPKDHPQVKEFQNAMLLVAQDAWKDKANSVIKRLQAENKICLTDGDIKDYEGYAGNFTLSASRKEKDGPPRLLNRDRSPLTASQGILYSGCWVNAMVGPWAQKNSWGERINCNLLGVQFVRNGEAFSGAPTISIDEFEAEVETEESTVDSGNPFD